MKFNVGSVLLVLFFCSTCHGLLLDVVKKCCRFGMDQVQPSGKSKTKKSSCEGMAVNVAGVSRLDMNMCHRSARVCCVKQMQMKYCANGISRAQRGRECIRHSKVGGDAQRECCDCCYLGIEARRTGQSCDVITLTYPCDEAFRRCCNAITDGGPIEEPTKYVPTAAPTTAYPLLRCAQAGCSQQCSESAQGPKCYCNSGYALQRDGRTCADRDECQFSPCGNDLCINTPGSYQCKKKVSCGEGYDYRNGRCLDRDECATTPCNTRTERCENTLGSYRCVPTPIVCATGFSPVDGRCTDVDECAQGLHACPQNTLCTNTQGSYACFRERCKAGYRREQTSQACEDINECLQSPCVNARQCTNTPGSYECTCWDGWRLNADRRTCEDIDECSSGQKLCHHNCVNVVGSYVCDCKAGYKRRQSDKRLCDDVNECALGKPCLWQCENTPGSYRCLCPPKLFRRVDNRCEDVDECARRTVSCSEGQTCFNTYGGFQCIPTRCQSEFFREVAASKTANSGQCIRDCTKFTGSKLRQCSNTLTQSMRWWATSLRSPVAVNSYRFTYRIQPAPGYQAVPVVIYSLENAKGYFATSTSIEPSNIDGYPPQYLVTVRNTRQLNGPRYFRLKLGAQVKVKDVIISKFEAHLYVFVSQYNFY